MELKWNRRRCGIHCESSLNRTFMELKFVTEHTQVSLIRGFKSHLYGIEMADKCRCKVRALV